MQHFYCEICKATETVSLATSMVYHRHNTVLTILSVVPEHVQDKVQVKVAKKSVTKKASTL